MPLLAINARNLVAVPDASGTDLEDLVLRSLADQPPNSAITVLIHGFRYSPYQHKINPHRQILALEPDDSSKDAISWPKHLGFGRDQGDGLCIGFGWDACGTIWQAHAQAETAGRALAHLIRSIQRIDNSRRVDLLAHSLGVRVVLAALPHLAGGSIGRAILMAGAEFSQTAARAVASPAGCSAEFFNITTRENDVFDALLELLIKPAVRGDRALGHGLPDPKANWLDIQIDSSAVVAALARHGHRIAGPSRGICHWSPYVRPGLFPFYRSLLRSPGVLPMPVLRATLLSVPDRRWSRLFGALERSSGLPAAGNAAF